NGSMTPAIMVLSQRRQARQNRTADRTVTLEEPGMNHPLARVVLPAVLLIGSCAAWGQEAPPTVIPPPAVDDSHASNSAGKALLAGGCYWGTQGIFEHVKGIKHVVAGFAGGHSDEDGGAESVMITFDPK